MRADATTPSAIAEAAFVSTYPLVAGRRRMARDTAVAAPDPATMRAPVNTLVHGRATPDTLHCSGWLDLASGPLVLSVPDTRGRYYALWLRDAWDHVFACVGARATGTGRGAFALLGPAQHEVPLPAGLTPICAPTRTVCVAGRIEAVGETDAHALARAYDGFRLAPLNGSPERPADPVAPPNEHVDARTFFAAVLRLIADDPPDRSERAALDRLRALGSSAELAESLDRGVRRGLASVHAARDSAIAHGWMRRAGDPTADAFAAYATTDSEQRPLSGERRYVVRFAPDAAPPVHGFWELTAGVRSIGDRHPLALGPDGALTIHIQPTPPARIRMLNWLPVPAGAFELALHLYWPRDEAWGPPPIDRVD